LARSAPVISWNRRRQLIQVHIRRQWKLPRMHSRDCRTTLVIRRLNHDRAVEPSRT
jgi:hypothetical protein